MVHHLPAFTGPARCIYTGRNLVAFEVFYVWHLFRKVALGNVKCPLHINNTILNCKKNYAVFSFIVVSHPKADTKNDCFGDLDILQFNFVNPNHFTICTDILGQASVKSFGTLIPYFLSWWSLKISFKMLNAIYL